MVSLQVVEWAHKAFEIGVLGCALHWWSAQHVGPRSTGTVEDPQFAQVRAIAHLRQNAGPFYEQAFEALSPPAKYHDATAGRYEFRKPWHEWRRVCRGFSGEPVPADLSSWALGNDAVIELARQGAQWKGCGFVVEYDDSGTGWPTGEGGVTKAMVNADFVMLRARLAADAHDLFSVCEYLQLADRIVRHVSQRPNGEIPLPSPGHFLATVAHEALKPLQWEGLEPSEVRDYVRRILVVTDPPPNPAAAFSAERERTYWMLRRMSATKLADSFGFDIPVSLALPPERVMGEYDTLCAPAIALAEEPVEEYCNPANPHAKEISRAIRRLDDASDFELMYNLPFKFAKTLRYGFRNQLEHHAVCVSVQRGCRLALLVVDHRAREGHYPDSLTDLDVANPIDPVCRAPYVYRRLNDGFTLYSIGRDGIDDGGRHERFASFSRRDPEGDFVFWPIQD